MDLFGFFRRPPPQVDLERALQPILASLERLDRAFDVMRVDWETVTAHIDQLSNKVHRELGHVTRRKREVQELEGDCPPDEVATRRSQFSGGRRR